MHCVEYRQFKIICDMVHPHPQNLYPICKSIKTMSYFYIGQTHLPEAQNPVLCKYSKYIKHGARYVMPHFEDAKNERYHNHS